MCIVSHGAGLQVVVEQPKSRAQVLFYFIFHFSSTKHKNAVFVLAKVYRNAREKLLCTKLHFS
jgi:hypothetical protein